MLSRFCMLFLFLLATSLAWGNQDLLETEDVNKIMHQIFEKHVNKHEITVNILKNAFHVYIDQFDPDKVYLLEEEVRPFLDLSHAEMDAIMSQYKQQDFSAYKKLNQVIQKAIHRARAIRKPLEYNHTILFKGRAEQEKEKRSFAQDEQELKRRIRNAMILFIQDAELHFGNRRIQNHENQVLANYEDEIQEYEDRYLFEDEKGRPLSPEKQENLFVMHVVKALAKSLDAHTSFFDPTEAYDMRISLEKGFYGSGVIPKQLGDSFAVETLLQGSPAEKSGLIQADDKIIAINGVSTNNESFRNVADQLRIKKGETISLLLERDNREIEVRLTSGLIVINKDRVEVTSERTRDGVIGIISLRSFYKGEGGITSEEDMRRAIEKLATEGNLEGIVLDLTENSGGFLTEAVKVAGLFMTNGVVVVSKYADGEEHFYRDMNNKVWYDGPLVILTSKATASAAEILAQALQDYGIAIVVGDEQTYGKGTIQSQTVTNNKGTSYFKVTVGKYYTVSGNSPEIQGVKADIVVPGPLFNEEFGEEYVQGVPVEQLDKIPENFADKLSDVAEHLRPWYLHYYVPTLQHKKQVWRSMLPVLKRRSAERVSHNQEYQRRLARGMVSFKQGERLQMQEAVNIVKDMVAIERETPRRSSAHR